MESLETELERARALDVAELADAVESIGFECTRCGACCKAESDEPHTATVFPDEVRDLQDAGDYDWRDVARPMPFGLDGTDGDRVADEDAEDAGGGPEDAADSDRVADDGAADAAVDEPAGTTFEWALQTDACGDCAFYEEREDATSPTGGTDAVDAKGEGDAAEASGDADAADATDALTDSDVGPGHCTVHEDRPLICQTYPFSLALGGTSQPMGEAVDEAGLVRAHECEGLGRDIDREAAEDLAGTLKERAVRELEEAIDVRAGYEPVDADGVVVYDSEGPKRSDGRPLDRSDPQGDAAGR